MLGNGSPFLILGCTGQAAWPFGWPYPRAGRATGPPNLGGQYTAHEKLVKRKETLDTQNVVATCLECLDVVVRFHFITIRFSTPAPSKNYIHLQRMQKIRRLESRLAVGIDSTRHCA